MFDQRIFNAGAEPLPRPKPTQLALARRVGRPLGCVAIAKNTDIGRDLVSKISPADMARIEEHWKEHGKEIMAALNAASHPTPEEACRQHPCKDATGDTEPLSLTARRKALLLGSPSRVSSAMKVGDMGVGAVFEYARFDDKKQRQWIIVRRVPRHASNFEIIAKMVDRDCEDGFTADTLAILLADPVIEIGDLVRSECGAIGVVSSIVYGCLASIDTDSYSYHQIPHLKIVEKGPRA